MPNTWNRILCATLALVLIAGAALALDAKIAGRRKAVVDAAARGKAGIPALEKALADPSPLVRRPAASALARLGKPAAPALEKALSNNDTIVRRAALQGLCEAMGPGATAYISMAMKDESALVRGVAVAYLAGMQSRSAAAESLLQRAQTDADPQVRDLASQALWPYHKKTTLIRDRQDYDHVVHLVKTIALPTADWKFHTDPDNNGHLKKWFALDFDDSQWKAIPIGKAWNLSGYDYEGVAWYRREIEMPKEMEHVAVEAWFDGVDEMAWVWLNGEFVGQHDIGKAGWNKPFGIDITRQAKWGEKNLLVVRVKNLVGHGGIWKPARIEVLK